jgi:excinuclease UvrABC nuclease subunit
VNIFFRQVNTRNPATTVVGEIARSATKTTTDIQQVHTALDAELVGKVDRGAPWPNVKLVDGGQIGLLKAADVLARGQQRIENCLLKRALSVMLRKALFQVHPVP